MGIASSPRCMTPVLQWPYSDALGLWGRGAYLESGEWLQLKEMVTAKVAKSMGEHPYHSEGAQVNGYSEGS